jgi:ribosomal protein L35AE/L33A
VLEPWDTWRIQSNPKLGGGSWSHGTSGGSRAALRQEVGAGATGYVVALELHCARRWELAPRRGVAAPELPMSGGITRCHGHVGACEHTSYPLS